MLWFWRLVVSRRRRITSFTRVSRLVKVNFVSLRPQNHVVPTKTVFSGTSRVLLDRRGLPVNPVNPVNPVLLGNQVLLANRARLANPVAPGPMPAA